MRVMRMTTEDHQALSCGCEDEDGEDEGDEDDH
jgi:hypothetical protein